MVGNPRGHTVAADGGPEDEDMSDSAAEVTTELPEWAKTLYAAVDSRDIDKGLPTGGPSGPPYPN